MKQKISGDLCPQRLCYGIQGPPEFHAGDNKNSSLVGRVADGSTKSWFQNISPVGPYLTASNFSRQIFYPLEPFSYFWP